MTTSHSRPLSPSISPLRSPLMRSISGNRSALVLPRLKNVSVWPRSSASAVMCRPMKRVPPRIRIFSGLRLRARPRRAAPARRRRRRRGQAACVVSCASPRLLRARRGVGRDPVAHGLVPEQRVLRLQHPVILVREIHQLRWHAALLQRVEQLDAMVQRARAGRAGCGSPASAC